MNQVQQRIAEIRERLAKATVGEWETFRLGPESDERERLIVTTRHGEHELCGPFENDEDAEFIANAKADIEFLLTIAGV